MTIHHLAKFHHAHKTPGSIQYFKAWKQWLDIVLTALHDDLVHRLTPSPIGRDNSSNTSTTTTATRQLSLQLGHAADTGAMPSGFQSAHARVGYALGYFGRIRLLAHILLYQQQQCHPPHSSMFQKQLQQLFLGPTFSKTSNTSTNTTIKLTSIGGGPGFDFCAAAIVATFSNGSRKKSSSKKPSTAAGHTTSTSCVHATILDYEPGWESLVQVMAESTQSILNTTDDDTQHHHHHTCQFGGRCDITKSLLCHESNAACLALVDTTDLWTCQYCVTENATALRESNFVFFRELFAAVQEKTLFVFTDTTHRLWPELVDIVQPLQCYQIAFVHGHGRWKAGYQMVLCKTTPADALSSSSTILTAETMKLYNQFVRDRELHQHKLDRGYMRPKKLVPAGGGM